MSVLSPEFLCRSFDRAVIELISDIARLVSAASETYLAKRLEFLSAYQEVQQCPNYILRRVISDPRTTRCVLSAQRLIHDHGLQFGNMDDWQICVNEFHKVALGVAILRQGSYSCKVFTNLEGIVAFPGTGRCIRGLPPMALVDLAVTGDGRVSVDGVSVNSQLIPTFRHIEFSAELSLRPPEEANEAPEIYLTPWPELERAMELVTEIEAAHRLVASFGRVVFPIQTALLGVHSSVSFSSVPRVLYMSHSADPEVLAEAIVHESDHQMLFALTSQKQIWADEENASACVYRSPWREDARPLDGLLRGASAFTAVGEFWAALANSNSDREVLPMGRRAVLALFQATDALETVMRFGSISEAGKDVVAELRDRCANQLASLRTSPDYLVWERDSAIFMDRHNRAWTTRHHGRYTVGLL